MSLKSTCEDIWLSVVNWTWLQGQRGCVLAVHPFDSSFVRPLHTSTIPDTIERGWQGKPKNFGCGAQTYSNMKVHIAENLSSITISTNPGFFDPLKFKIMARHLSFRTVLLLVLLASFCLPFTFILVALKSLENVEGCRSSGTPRRCFSSTTSLSFPFFL